MDASEALKMVAAAIDDRDATDEDDADDLVCAYSKAIKKAIKIWNLPESQARRLTITNANEFLKLHLCELERPDGINLDWLLSQLEQQTFELKIRFGYFHHNREDVVQVVVCESNICN